MDIHKAELIISNIKDKCIASGSENELSLETIKSLIPILTKGDDRQLSLLTTLFKLLASACGRHNITPRHILTCKEILNGTFDIIVEYTQQQCQETHLCIEWALKFLGNFVTKIKEAKGIVYPMLIKIISSIIGLNNQNVKTYFYFACYNSLTNETTKDLMNQIEVIRDVFSCLIEDEEMIDWCFLIFEKLMKEEYFIEKCYPLINSKAKLFILDYLLEDEDRGKSLIPKHVIFLSQQLENDLEKIQHFSSLEPTNLETLEIQRELETICAASAHQEHNSIATESLLRITIATLYQVHQLSKNGDPNFEMINKVEQKMKTDNLEQSPLFGFKRDLIRLLGNICSSNPLLQTLAGKLEALQLVCDCSQIDERNPFIQQWCILAVQALTCNHPANQAILADFSKTGPFKNSQLLKEMKLSK